MTHQLARVRRRLLAVTVVCGVLSGLSAQADDYSAQWGPEVGSQIPVLAAYDQDGTLRTLDNLAGEQGLLLVFSRSADW